MDAVCGGLSLGRVILRGYRFHIAPGVPDDCDYFHPQLIDELGNSEAQRKGNAKETQRNLKPVTTQNNTPQ